MNIKIKPMNSSTFGNSMRPRSNTFANLLKFINRGLKAVGKYFFRNRVPETVETIQRLLALKIYFIDRAPVHWSN